MFTHWGERRECKSRGDTCPLANLQLETWFFPEVGNTLVMGWGSWNMATWYHPERRGAGRVFTMPIPMLLNIMIRVGWGEGRNGMCKWYVDGFVNISWSRWYWSNGYILGHRWHDDELGNISRSKCRSIWGQGIKGCKGLRRASAEAGQIIMNSSTGTLMGGSSQIWLSYMTTLYAEWVTSHISIS